MIQNSRLGHFVKSLPVPHEPEITSYFPAGPVTIGVEFRVFDPVAERAKLTEAEVAAAGPDSLFNQSDADQGVCIHVFDSTYLSEYFRFDCFLGEPHYHYIVPGEGNMLVHFDEVANGPMIDWVLNTVRHRLAPMLREVGADAAAAALDQQALARAMEEAEPLALQHAAPSGS